MVLSTRILSVYGLYVCMMPYSWYSHLCVLCWRNANILVEFKSFKNLLYSTFTVHVANNPCTYMPLLCQPLPPRNHVTRVLARMYSCYWSFFFFKSTITRLQRFENSSLSTSISASRAVVKRLQGHRLNPKMSSFFPLLLNIICELSLRERICLPSQQPLRVNVNKIISKQWD